MKSKSKKKITSHIHSRIAKLAQSAIDRGDIINCDRISNGDLYLIQQIVNGSPKTTQFTAVGAGSLLYLLNSLANSQTEPETEPETLEISETETKTLDW